MQHFLVFDSGCSLCSELAQQIQDATGDKLQLVSIHSDTANELLGQAYPNGWKYAPYVVAVDQQQVRAWTGFGAALRLGWLMGPRKAWSVYKLACQAGVRVPLNGNPGAYRISQRRRFLQLRASIIRSLGIAAIIPSKVALAYECGSCGAGANISCQSCGLSCAGCTSSVCSGCAPSCPCNGYFGRRCYDQCGEYCYTEYTVTCGSCRCA